MLLRWNLTLLFCLTANILVSQEYDYALPDSLPQKKERSTVQLPIKSRDPSPTYFVPSYEVDQQAENEPDLFLDDENMSSTKKNNTSVNLELGSSVSTDFNGNSAINTYAAPHVRHQIDENWAVSGGVIMSQTILNGWTSYSFDGGPMPSTIYSNTLYGRVDYRINDKMMVYGSIYKNITTIPSNGFNKQLDGISYSMGMEYKMSKNSFLQVQIQHSSGYNPMSPFSNNMGFGGRPFSYFP